MIRDENNAKIKHLLGNLRRESNGNVLASEAIVKLIEHHLSMSGASRLPVLIVAAAYKVAEKNLGERILPLEAHNAADKQTGALGDIQIALMDDAQVVTALPLLNRYPVIHSTDVIVMRYAQLFAALKKRNALPGLNDLWVAATALTLSCGVITRNAKHFSGIDGLAILNYQP